MTSVTESTLVQLSWCNDVTTSFKINVVMWDYVHQAVMGVRGRGSHHVCCLRSSAITFLCGIICHARFMRQQGKLLMFPSLSALYLSSYDQMKSQRGALGIEKQWMSVHLSFKHSRTDSHGSIGGMRHVYLIWEIPYDKFLKTVGQYLATIAAAWLISF